MPANIPNLSAVSAMGKQFTGNIFEKTAGRALARTRIAGRKAVASRHAEAHARATQMPAQPEKTFSPAPPDTKLSDNAVGEGRARRQAKAGYTPPSASGHAAPNFKPSARQNNMPNNGLNQPAAPKHAAPSFRSPSAEAKAASSGTPAFSDSSASSGSVPRPANMFSSAHTNATPTFSHVNQMNTTGNSGAPKPSIDPFSTAQATPASTPHPVHQTSTAQFHGPQESSRTPLPNLTAAHSTPTAPNTFTHGSNKVSASSQGIGHMGANLEASLTSRPFRARKA